MLATNSSNFKTQDRPSNPVCGSVGLGPRCQGRSCQHGDTEPVLSEQQRPRVADDLRDTRAIVLETGVMCCMLSAPPWRATGRPFNSEPHAPFLTGSVDGIQRERLLQSSSFRCLRLLMFSLISCFTLLVSWDKTCSAKAERVIQPPSLHVREGLILALPLAAV